MAGLPGGENGWISMKLIIVAPISRWTLTFGLLHEAGQVDQVMAEDAALVPGLISSLLDGAGTSRNQNSKGLNLGGTQSSAIAVRG